MKVDFLPDNEMGNLTRGKDWSKTSLGAINTWPQSLRTTLSIILNSKFPMFLWWGPELICFYNDAYRPSLGVNGKHPDILGQTAKAAWPEIWETISPLIDQVLTGGGATWSEDQLIPIYRNGKIEDVYWTFSYSPINDESGKVAGVLVTCNETTDKVLTQQRFKESTLLFRAIVESSDDAIITKRLDGIITSWNDGAQRIFHYTPEEIIGQSISKLIPLNRITEEPEIIARLKKGERVDHFETQRLTKKGDLIDLSLTISPLRDQSGTIIGASKIARDITKQKKVEREIQESEKRLQTIIEASSLGTWELDLVTKMPTYSGRYLEILGFKSSDKPSHSELLERLHPEDMRIREQAFKDAYESGRLYYAARLIWPDKSIRWMEGRGNVFYNDQRKPVKMIGTVRDITEEKNFSQILENKVAERTRDLRQVNQELEKTNHELASFAYVSSHDLQEPLRKIQTFASRVVEKEHENLSPLGKDYFSRMQEAARRMQYLIQDLLAYSRTNKKEEEFLKTDLNALIEGVKNDLEQTIQEKGATISVGDLPEINVIPFQLRQLFTNLFSNSLKFSRSHVPPKIKVEATLLKAKKIQLEGVDPTKNYWLITVQDNGIGFEAEYSTRIFEVFQRLHGRDAYDGTGIGLAICKKIVENHHGMITATGIPGEGATFSVYIPVL